ncbi:head-tail adaptor [Xenorhabdus bovienii]|uniref:head-tail adaptor n=1 Tax=Xenorhabdus bovienii TaxID=40576 RepID=UPI0023B34610|nr:head-tail adaptor [Xenorhabdus bovienii]MDE9437838.1 head-tail adaptor [Xenorhabdus bovienii]MDE9455824.1 head-tail adaptor [Xenorhabdus bovienii]MDE9499317.1 head-tail adaptor [Xenorhabdus bovienii]MDE9553532.1 head-tail adaptor [Xenorhabdus bovienii]
MDLLDVTDILSDPDFCDTSLTVKRRVTSVDSDGFPTTTDTISPFSGVVTVDRSVEAQLRMSGQVVTGSILIITTERLIAGETGRAGDIVTYQNREYLVKLVDPYTAYGAGFVQAHCELLPFDGGSP